MLHRNSQKRIYGRGTYFLTCNTSKRYPYFRNLKLCEIRIKHLTICTSLKEVALHAFCLNYDHFHLLLTPNERVASISEIMRSLKTNTSREINRLVDVSKFQRQKSYHDHYIRDAGDFKNHWYYTKDNYRKHGLPEDRPYHSGNVLYEDMIDSLSI